MNARRTDLALEAHALFRAAQRDDAIDGLTLTERTRRGCAVTTVTVEGEAASRALGKPRGTYVTLDLRALSPEDPAYTERARRSRSATSCALSSKERSIPPSWSDSATAPCRPTSSVPAPPIMCPPRAT